MKKSAIIGCTIISIVILGVGTYFGLQGQYFGKDLGTHVIAVCVSDLLVCLLFLGNVWLKGRR